MNEKLKKLRGEIEDRRKKLSTIFEEAGDDMDMSQVKSVDGDSAAKVAHIRSLNDEIDERAKQLEPLEAEFSELERAKRQSDRLGELKEHPGHPAPKSEREREAPTKSIGELFIESRAGGELKGQSVEIPDVDVKTLMSTSAGWTPESIRTGRIVESAQRPIQVLDMIPSGATGQQSVVYMRETTFTNGAAETAEGGPYGEAAFELTETSEPVRKVGVWLPITDEQLDDVPQAQGYVNNRLPFMLRQRLDSQVQVGNGNAPNLSGFLDRGGIQTQAKGADPRPDAYYKAMTKVRVNGRAIPGGHVINPLDWEPIRLLRTADGIYIWGSPSEAGPERMWGLPVALSDGLPQGTGLVGDFANFSELTWRRGIEVKVSDSHGEFFTNGKQAIRADVRAALCVWREPAFCEVTGQ